MGNVSFAQIRVNAIEDQTTTAQGSEILLFVTPEGDIASNRVAALEVRASGVTSDVGFVGDISGGSGEFTTFTGKYLRNVRDAGIIADAGTLLIDFATDALVKCEWDNNFTVTYSNYTEGSVVKIIAYKRGGTGTDSFSLGTITPGHVSSGSTTVAGTAGQANFVELTCIGTTISEVYAKL